MSTTGTHTQGPVITELDGDTAVVTINNPPLNLLSRAIKGQLLEAFQSLRIRDGVRAVILQSAGSRAFCAGADIMEFAGRIADDDAGLVAQEGHRLIRAVRDCGKPVIAVVDGPVLGAGLELILAADLRIASHDAFFAFPEVTRGVFPGNGGTQLLPRLVGPAHALQLMLTGSRIDSAEAHRIGLVHQLASAEELTPLVHQLANRLAALPRTAVASIRRLVDASNDLALTEGLHLEARLFAEVFRTQAVREGVSAFQEKRPPDFREADRSSRKFLNTTL